MKKNFSRFMSLALALIMLLSVTASAEPALVTKGHAVINWLGEVAEAYMTMTTDEDGCTRYELTLSENDVEALKAFLQLGKDITLGSGAEDALTITPEALEEALTLLQSLMAGDSAMNEEAAQYAEMAAAVFAVLEVYFQSEDFGVDAVTLEGVLMNEVNRLAGIAFGMGCISQNEAGEILVELTDSDIAALLCAYLTDLAADTSVVGAISSLKIWGYFDTTAEDASAMLTMLCTELAQFAAQMSETLDQVENTHKLTAVIGQNGLHAEYSYADYGDSTSAELTVEGEAFSLRIDSQRYSGSETLHVAAATLEDGSIEANISFKDFSDETEIYCLIAGDSTTVNVKSYSPYDGLTEVSVYVADGIVSVTVKVTKDDEELANFALLINESGLDLTFVCKDEFSSEACDLHCALGVAGLDFQSEYTWYDYVSDIQVAFDPASMTLTANSVNTDGESFALVCAPASETTFGMQFQYTADDCAAEGAGVIDFAAQTADIEINATSEYEDDTKIVFTAKDSSATLTATCGEDKIEMILSSDPESMTVTINLTATIDGETVSVYEEGKPVMTEDTIAYVYDLTMTDGEQSYKAVLTFGLRDLEPENVGSLHGEVFMTLETDLPLSEEELALSNLAVEFNFKQENPLSLELILKLAGQPIGSFLGEYEVTMEEAPAHVEGYPISGQELFQVIMSLIPVETESSDINGNAA